MTPEQLELLLSQVMQPEKLQEAEATLNRAMQTPAFICDLAERLRHSASPQVRQLAAVLMRRRIGSHWRKLDPTTQQQLKAALLARIENLDEEGSWIESAGAPYDTYLEPEEAP